jgi:hypothetical protein
MPCDFPEHHGSGDGFNPMAVVVVVVAAALLAGVITALIHIVAVALTFIGLGAVAAGVIAVPLWLRRARERRAMMAAGRYVPFMQPAPRRQFGAQQPPPASLDGGQHLHLHLGGLSASERDEVIRQLRGGQ